jgi:FKBP-type peptidyl-prolyl cis-trans isomerase
MNSKVIKLGILSVVIASVFTACKNSGSFQTDSATGVQYKFINHNENGTKPAMNDYARVKLVGVAVSSSGKDTEMFNSNKTMDPRDTNKSYMIPLHKSFNGCLEQGIAMMAIGDSAVFKVNADSLFMKTFSRGQKTPPFIKPGSDFTFYVKLVSIKTQNEVNQMQQAEMARRQAEAEKHKAEEAPAIAKYLADNHYEKVKPTKDSLFVLERSGGKGKAIKDGDSVEVSYKGTLLDGTEFDASAKHGGSLKMLYKADMQLIKGWVEMLGTMHEGEKAKILVPSSLAYGPRQAGPMIPPYSPLVFELEVLKVSSNK